MSSKKGEQKSPNASNIGTDQISSDVKNLSLNLEQNDGWEVYSKKNKNKGGNTATVKQWHSRDSSTSKAWEQPQKLGILAAGGSGKGSSNAWPSLSTDFRRTSGGGNVQPQSTYRGSEAFNNVSPPVIPPPLKHGWDWATKSASNQSLEGGPRKNENEQTPIVDDIQNSVACEVVDDDDDTGSDELDDTDDDLLSDEFDSDVSQKSYETRKKNRWFKELFECLDSLTVEQINDMERQWHCPACKGGPGAIDWYRGLQPLLAHAKTKGSKRVKLHRELAQLLEQEFSRRGTSVFPSGEMYGKWKGLDEKEDREIVWPPTVVVMNTILEKDENDHWTGMGNQELLGYFCSYNAQRARHSYGPQGHRGMSVLMFEASAMGYLEAERLSQHFSDNRKDREAWERNRVLFYPGGKRQLYGYMAEKRDLDIFNQHSLGKSKLKFDMRSYQEMVVKQMKQMSEDNQQLIWFKNKVAKEQRYSKALEESFGLVSEKYRQTLEENRIVRLRTKMQHEQNKEEMDFQEKFFKEQIQIIYDARNEKEEKFEKMQQEQREKMKVSHGNPSSETEYRCRGEEISKFIKFQDKEMEEFVAEREKLIKVHEEKLAAMRHRHWQEEVALEEAFDKELNGLMEKYTPLQPEGAT